MSFGNVYPELGNLNPGVVELDGYLSLSAGNDPTIVAGTGFTVSSNTQGIITISTLNSTTYYAVAAASVEIVSSTGSSTARVFWRNLAPQSGTFSFNCQSTSGTLAELSGVDVVFSLKLLTLKQS